MEVIPKTFFERDPEIVAKELLGKVLVRRLHGKVLSGFIVETEAYYGEADPASRAHHGMKSYNRMMWGEPGTAFIYNVHKYWMFNVVAHEPETVGAILIRAVEPLEGLETMRGNRYKVKIEELTSGPGKLTIAFQIDRSMNGSCMTTKDNDVFIAENQCNFRIGCSHRIGVRKDLERELRFYVKGNRFVSR